MPNGTDHRFVAAASAFSVAAANWSPENHWSKHPLVAACVASGCGTLPDLVEPATSPHHRQFFHSVLFAAALGLALYQTYQWEPETEVGQILRRVALLAGGAYLIHLAMDATTARSLPLIGK
jgi:inner membrane protein